MKISFKSFGICFLFIFLITTSIAFAGEPKEDAAISGVVRKGIARSTKYPSVWSVGLLSWESNLNLSAQNSNKYRINTNEQAVYVQKFFRFKEYPNLRLTAGVLVGRASIENVANSDGLVFFKSNLPTVGGYGSMNRILKFNKQAEFSLGVKALSRFISYKGPDSMNILESRWSNELFLLADWRVLVWRKHTLYQAVGVGGSNKALWQAGITWVY